MSESNSTLTAERARELLCYDPETGVLTRRIEWYGKKAGAAVGTDNGKGYLYCVIDGRPYALHRLAWLYVYGVWPTEIDHINRSRGDNRLANLREATRAENQANRGMHSNNKSGFQGVSWHKAKKRWNAIIYRSRTKHHLGYFKTPQEASLAYIAAREALEGGSPGHPAAAMTKRNRGERTKPCNTK